MHISSPFQVAKNSMLSNGSIRRHRTNTPNMRSFCFTSLDNVYGVWRELGLFPGPSSKGGRWNTVCTGVFRLSQSIYSVMSHTGLRTGTPRITKQTGSCSWAVCQFGCEWVCVYLCVCLCVCMCLCLCICVYMFVSLCLVCVYVYLCVSVCGVSACMCAFMCASLCLCVCAHEHTCPGGDGVAVYFVS